jgi:hypothetical protein
MDRPISLVTPFSDLSIKLFDLLIVRASDLGECSEQLAERSKIMFRWVFVVYTLSARFEPILNYACTNRDTLDKESTSARLCNLGMRIGVQIMSLFTYT